MKNKTAQVKNECNHFMVWSCQNGYSIYRCDKCNFFDGEKTFKNYLPNSVIKEWAERDICTDDSLEEVCNCHQP